MSKEHSNIQTYTLVVSDSKGHVWVVGTETQRGFTEAGAMRALARVEEALPSGWDAWIAPVHAVSEILAIRQR